MAPSRFPPSAAMRVAVAFAAGTACAPPVGYLPLLASGCASAAVALALGRRGRLPLVAALSFLAGAWIGAVDAAESARTWRGWLAEDGGNWEGHLRGTVLRAPERAFDGSWRLRVAVRPEPDPLPGAPPMRVRFTVAPSGASREADLRLERAGAGDSLRLWGRVGRPRHPGNPGQSDARVWLAARGEQATGWIKSARLVELGGPRAVPIPGPDRALSWMRGRLDRALGLFPEGRALAGAMLLGDRGGVSPDVERVFRDSGLSHLMAVSGLHVGIVVVVLLAVVPVLRRSPRGSLLVVGGTILAYATLTGSSASVSRAAGMVLLAWGARAAGRTGEIRTSLSLAVAGVLAIDPARIDQAGFRLSVAAVAGIATLRPARGAAPWSAVLAVSAAAYAATAPILAHEFHRVAPWSLLASPPGVLLGGAILAGALVSACMNDIPGLGTASGEGTLQACRMLLALANGTTGLPGAGWRVPSPGPLTWAVHLAAWAVLAVSPRRRVTLRRFALAAFLGALAAVHLGPPPGSRARPHASVYDVGQGQAVAFLGSSGTCALVDAGGSGGGRYDLGENLVVPLLLDGGCRRLEVLALSHAHDDHAGGAVGVVRGMEVGSLWIPTGSLLDPGVRAAVDAARERGTAVRLVGRGTREAVAGWSWHGIHPSRTHRPLPVNDRGLAVLVTSPEGSRLLLGGDLERRGEIEALESQAVPRAHAAVANHHGARNSNGPEWLATVAPDVVVISVGAANRFGHPHPESLDRFAAAGSTILRTDLDGQVRLYPTPGGFRPEATVARNAGARE